MNNLDKFKGIFVALLTPFDENGVINYNSLQHLMEYNLKKNVAGFYVNGSTAEVYCLEDTERENVYRACAECGKGKGTLIAQVGDTALVKVKRYAKLCEELGYDAISAVPPFYYKYTENEIIDYYKAIADSCNLPIIIYNIPIFSGVALSLNIFSELLKDDRFIGVKFTSSDFYTFERIRERFPDKILYNGYDEILVSGLAMGADGAIGSNFNIIAEMALEIFELCKNNRFEDALKKQHLMNDIISSAISSGDCKGALKRALTEIIGIPMGNSRSPTESVSDGWFKEFNGKFKNKLIKF